MFTRLITITLLLTMISSIEGWALLTTPLSALSLNPVTRHLFTYFVTLQALILGALYKRKNVKPLLAFIGIASLILLDIYIVCIMITFFIIYLLLYSF